MGFIVKDARDGAWADEVFVGQSLEDGIISPFFVFDGQLIKSLLDADVAFLYQFFRPCHGTKLKTV